MRRRRTGLIWPLRISEERCKLNENILTCLKTINSFISRLFFTLGYLSLASHCSPLVYWENVDRMSENHSSPITSDLDPDINSIFNRDQCLCPLPLSYSLSLSANKNPKENGWWQHLFHWLCSITIGSFLLLLFKHDLLLLLRRVDYLPYWRSISERLRMYWTCQSWSIIEMDFWFGRKRLRVFLFFLHVLLLFLFFLLSNWERKKHTAKPSMFFVRQTAKIELLPPSLDASILVNLSGKETSAFSRLIFLLLLVVVLDMERKITINSARMERKKKDYFFIIMEFDLNKRSSVNVIWSIRRN